MRMRRVFSQAYGVVRRRHRLERLPIDRRACGLTDIGVVIEDLDRHRIFAGDDQIENLPRTRRAFGNVLLLQFLHVSLAGLLSHGDKYITDELWRTRAATGRPHHLPFPTRVEKIVVSLRELAGFYAAGIVAEGHEINVGATPKAF